MDVHPYKCPQLFSHIAETVDSSPCPCVRTSRLGPSISIISSLQYIQLGIAIVNRKGEKERKKRVPNLEQTGLFH